MSVNIEVELLTATSIREVYGDEIKGTPPSWLEVFLRSDTAEDVMSLTTRWVGGKPFPRYMKTVSLSVGWRQGAELLENSSVGVSVTVASEIWNNWIVFYTDPWFEVYLHGGRGQWIVNAELHQPKSEQGSAAGEWGCISGRRGGREVEVVKEWEFSAPPPPIPPRRPSTDSTPASKSHLVVQVISSAPACTPPKARDKGKNGGEDGVAGEYRWGGGVGEAKMRQRGGGIAGGRGDSESKVIVEDEDVDLEDENEAEWRGREQSGMALTALTMACGNKTPRELRLIWAAVGGEPGRKGCDVYGPLFYMGFPSLGFSPLHHQRRL
ncbi:hypothetical protein BV22DRAFT_1051941 [Leucogyrophana mollusca]|uniref:Uncharacterized protein n=1 Tax=Leucogyrophana mollusca TaxID=85980 RepID=A0ACB8AY60_9AGAM|nr:hypothetical protein BV22DRAFT_1051941 [Leucogyrophana mollusca]